MRVLRSGGLTPERWNQVKELMDAALGVAPQERPAFIAARAGEDHELRQEVLSLLASHDDAGDFLEPAAATQPGPAAQPPADLIGTRVGAYQLVRELGRGGMGAVYLGVRADNVFRKEVAVKLIRRGMESGFALSRFQNERQILARLEHPNIARLIDGGTTPDGSPYFIMEYVEGEALMAYCESRSLPLAQRVEIFQHVCSAVHYAHRRMIIHRDLKPSNILVRQDGSPMLLDFGVAKILDPQPGESTAEATVAGFRMMTPAYASPEQVRGEPASVRSDVFALGLILWELVTGRPVARREESRSFDLPETGGTDTNSPLLRNLRNVVRKATRDRVSERYESVDAMSADLQKALAGEDVLLDDSEAAAGEVNQGSIAVLPFQNLGPDLSENYLGVGIADAIITRLSNIGRIAVRPTSAVMKFAGGSDAIQAGGELKVQFVLEGRVQHVRGRVRVTVQLVEVRAAKPVWAATFNEQLDDLLKMEDSIAAQVAQALVPQMTGEEHEQLAQPGTSSAKAHQLYLRGRWYWSLHTEESLPHALMLFSEAVAEDPNYGRAHSGIADYHIAIGMRSLLPPVEAFAAAMHSAQKAIELDGKIAEAHASLGLTLWLMDGDSDAAAHEFQLAIALNPEWAVAHDWFGLMSAARGRTGMALASIERARQLDPNSEVFLADLAMCHYNNRDYQQVYACLSKPGGAAAAPPLTNGAVLPLSFIAQGEAAGAIDAAMGYCEATRKNCWSLAVLARAKAAAANLDGAQSLLTELEKEAKQYYVPGVALALANLACGRKTEAIEQLERGCRDREWWTAFLWVMPIWDELRGIARFDNVAKAGGKGRRSRLSAFRDYGRRLLGRSERK